MGIKKSELIELMASLPDDGEIVINYDGYWYPALDCTIEDMQGNPVALIDFEPFPCACNIPRED